MVRDIGAWLAQLQLGEYAGIFAENKIRFEHLSDLSEDDLKELGITAMGDRKTLLRAIADPAGGNALETDGMRELSDRSSPRGGEAERRQLTVMFIDLVGSTALSGRLDPEDMRDVIRAYQDRCAGVITRFDGYVAKFMGDGILAYFGYPRAHEDDGERAVRAGLAIMQAMAGMTTSDGAPLEARIGIATGLVVVGDLVGEGSSQEEAVVGETPNLAARLQGLAEPGQVAIAAATRRLLGADFALDDLGEHMLKGIALPTAVFSVVGERAPVSRFEARSGLLMLPLVGRDQELALLLERWNQAKAGEGQGVLLVGEAGIGKSRISHALIDALADEPHIRVRYQCSPYHSDSALWPVIQQLSRAAKFVGEESIDTRLDKLEALLALAGDTGDAAPLIADLVGLDGTSRYGPTDLTPQVHRLRTLEALVSQLLGLAAGKPVLMVLEDAHWIDPTTLDFIERCLDQISATPVLALLTSRPDNQPILAGHPHVTRLTLNRLGRQGVEAIVTRLGGDTLPAEAIATIITRTDGVPLFVEELTKAVLESGETTIPASLHDSLMARLDRVPEIKEVAQTAACIGREFDYSLLATVTEKPENELRQSLDKLAAAELIFRRGTAPDARYTFKHALVQDAAYQSLLKSRRQILHGRIADALEGRTSGKTGAEPEVLAQHLGLAGRHEQAVHYWQKAGDRAIRQFAYTEAITHLNNGLTLLETLPTSPSRNERELALLRTLGTALIYAKGWSTDDVKANYDRAKLLCETVGDDEALFEILRGLWQFYLTRTDLVKALDLGRQLLDHAEHVPGAGRQLEANYALGASYIWRGEFDFAKRHFEAGRALHEQQSHADLARKYGHYSGVVCLYLGAQTHWCLGYPDLARSYAKDARTLARQLPFPFSLAITLMQSAFLLLYCRDPVAASALANEAHATASKYGFPALSAELEIVRGWAWAQIGRRDQGMAQMRLGFEAFEAMGLLLQRPCYLALLAEMYAELGDVESGMRATVQALTLSRQTAEGFAEAEIHRVNSKLILAKRSDIAQAVTCLEEALRIARRQNAMSWQLRSARDLARLWAENGERQRALALLLPVYDWFEEGFDTPDLIEAKALLDELN